MAAVEGCLVGTLGSPARAVVDGVGRLHLDGGTVVGWWVGAEDRWHLPEHEVAVRQHLVDGMPVVETAMRVPGGDVVERVYAVPTAGVSAAIVELENRSSVPVAVAVVVSGPPVDVASPREPAQRAATTVGGAALEVRIFPLAHIARLTVGIGLDGALRALPSPLPSAVAVAKGWEAQGGRGVRVEVPDAALADGLDAARRQLLLAELGDGRLLGATGSEAAVIAAFDRLGFHPESERVLLDLARTGRVGDDPAALVLAIDQHLATTGNGELAGALAELVADAADAARRRPGPRTVSALAASAALLERAGERRAARAARRDAERLDAGRPDAERLDPLRPDAGRLPVEPSPSPSATPDPSAPAVEPPPVWTEAAATARFVLSVLDRLLRAADGELLVAPDVPPGWLGQGWEVHEVPTPFGRCSYAVRWHGSRPALLWQVEGDGPVRLRAPGLDPDWSSSERRGETLLAAPRSTATAEGGGSFS